MKLTKTEAAARIGGSEKTLDRLIHAGKIPATKIRGRLEIFEADVNAFLAQRAAGPMTSTGARA
jgi:excisionase family DNA binding protein